VRRVFFQKNRASILIPVREAAPRDLRVLKRRKKNIVTLAIVPFRQKTVLEDSAGRSTTAGSLRALSALPLYVATMYWFTSAARVCQG